MNSFEVIHSTQSLKNQDTESSQSYEEPNSFQVQELDVTCYKHIAAKPVANNVIQETTILLKANQFVPTMNNCYESEEV